MTRKQDDGLSRPRTLKQLREAAGVTQTEAAQRMGVNRQRIGHIEAKYPAVRYDVLLRYMEAIGGHIRLSVAGMQINLGELEADPALAGTRDYLTENASRVGVRRLTAEAAFSPVTYTPSAEELPLEQRTADTGSNDPGRDVDQPDPEGHQGDRNDREEP